MQIAILSLVFPPDNVSTAHLMGGLARTLQERGHQVTVVTTTPHYNFDAVADRAQPRRSRRGGLAYESSYHGIPVLHISMPKKRGGIPARLGAWAWFSTASAVAALGWVRRPDVILAPSPPLTIGLSAFALSQAVRAPFVYNVQEIYPDVAVSLGALRNPAAIGALERVESFIYDRAGAVTVIGAGMRRRLLEKGVAPGKVHVIPNYVDLAEIVPAPKDNAFSRERGVHDRFVVSYAGNLGPAQGLDCFVGAASVLSSEKGVVPMIIGEGTERQRLLDLAERRRATTLRFVPHQPYSRVPEIYGASDVCLIAQGKGTGLEALPSKVYRIMAAAKPILACTDPESDLADLVRESRCGVVVPAGDEAALAKVMLEAARNPDAWIAMGRAGKEYVATRYSLGSVAEMYERLFSSLGDGGTLHQARGSHAG